MGPIVLILVLLSACSAPHKEIGQTPSGACSYRYYDMEIIWTTAPTGNAIHLTGTVRNLRSFFLQDFELTAILLDENGRALAESSTPPSPNLINMNEPVPFSLKFVLTPGQIAKKIRFKYTYYIKESPPAVRGGRDEGVPRTHSFEADL